MARNNEGGAKRERPLWAEKRFLAAGSAVLAVLGTVSGIIYMENDDSKKTEAERAMIAKLRAEKAAVCGSLMRSRRELPTASLNRKHIINRLFLLGKCTDPKAIEFNFENVCKQISDGIRSSEPKWRHPILNPFYLMLYDELKCAENERPKDMRPELDDLLKALEDSEAVKKFHLIDPSRSTRAICEDAVTFAKESREDIKAVSGYILDNESRLLAGSRLKAMLDQSRAKYRAKHDGKEPQKKDLQAPLHIGLTVIAAIPSVRGFCKLPIQQIIQLFDKELTEDQLSEKRRLALPLVREILALLNDQPETEESRKVSKAILNMAHRMSVASQKSQK